MTQRVASAFIFTVSLIIFTYGFTHAMYGGLSNSDKASVGATLSSVSWNRIIDGVIDLDSRVSNFSFSGGNIGIGTSNPLATLDINGSVSSQ